MALDEMIPGMIIVLIISFVWSWIATNESYAIAQGNPALAAAWGSANCALNFILTFIIAATLTIAFIFPYVLGSTVATYIVLVRKAK